VFTALAAVLNKNAWSLDLRKGIECETTVDERVLLYPCAKQRVNMTLRSNRFRRYGPSALAPPVGSSLF
jgi:hypothetical protein